MEAPLWAPSAARIGDANITRFAEEASAVAGRTFCDYEQLHRWSVEQPEQFWPLVWEFGNVKSKTGWQSVLTNRDVIHQARWFEGATLNFAENLLPFRDEHPAIIARDESSERREISYAQLAREVTSLGYALQDLGVNKNDRVAAYLPNIPEAIISMLGVTSFGAIWSSCSSDFGVSGVLDRFGQIDPTVLIAADGYSYNGKAVDCRERVREVAEKLPSVRTVIFVGYLNRTLRHEDLPTLRSDQQGFIFSELIAKHSSATASFPALLFNHPLAILYSSGTTGRPKCIVHGAGGTLIQHLKELLLHTDLRRNDRIFYYTTCGWMMWNWLVSSLAVGATVLLYEGSPLTRDGNVLFDLVDTEQMTIFGTSAKYISALKKNGVCPKKTHKLDSLKTMLSTGSPLLPELFDYVYQELKSDLCLSSISGGTDIISCFALGNPTLPVYRGQLQAKGLGMDVDVFDESGRSVRRMPGELVCKSPFPSQPLGFWNDPSGEKYRDAYFSTFKNVWRHGDWVEVTPQNGLIIYGRSDAVLNPGGVRIGTAELYRVVENFPEIEESLAIGQSWEGDERVILFLKMREGIVLDDEFRLRIRNEIKVSLTPRHIPAKIIAVPDIPRTVNGKISELAVKHIIRGLPVKNTEALANPTALEYFRNMTELQEP